MRNPLDKVSWVYLLAFFACFLTYADRYLYRIERLPTRQGLFLVMVTPLVLLLLSGALVRGPTVARLRTIARGEARVLAVFGLLGVLTLLWTLRPGAYWGEGIQYLLYAPFYTGVFFVSLFLPALAPVLRGWRGFFLGSLLLLMATTLVDVFFPGFFSKSETRASGLAVNPNDAALSITLLTACLVHYGRTRLQDGVLVGAAGAAVFFTLSRGGLVLYAVFLAGYFFSTLRLDRYLVRRSLTTAAVAVALVPLVWTGVSYLVRTQEFFRSTYFLRRQAMFSGEADLVPHTEGRVQLVDYYLDLALRSPILGYGTAFDRMQDVGSPHNMYLLYWVNFGILGVSLYVAVLVLGAYQFARRGFPQGVMFVVMILLAGFFSHNLLEGIVFPLMFGVLLAVSRLEREARAPAASPGPRPVQGRARPALAPTHA